MPDGLWKRPANEGEAMIFALKHPLRRALLLAYEGGVYSPSELVGRLRKELSLVAYHTRALHFYGTVELVETRPSRGSTQHFYTVTDLGRRALELGRRTGVIEEPGEGGAQPG